MAGSLRTRPFRGWGAAFALGLVVGMLARQPYLAEAHDPEATRWRHMLLIQEQKVRRSQADLQARPSYPTARCYALQVTLLREYQCRAHEAGVRTPIASPETAYRAALAALEHASSDEEHAEANRIVLRASSSPP